MVTHTPVSAAPIYLGMAMFRSGSLSVLTPLCCVLRAASIRPPFAMAAPHLNLTRAALTYPVRVAGFRCG
jgi:hypothetical protein